MNIIKHKKNKKSDKSNKVLEIAKVGHGEEVSISNHDAIA
jgi:hypothetical protein